MKEKFIERKFKSDTLALVEACSDIVDEYAADGYDLTVRQLYYRFIALDIFP